MASRNVLPTAVFLVFLAGVLTESVKDEAYLNMLAKLRKDLLKNYDIHSRPVQKFEDTVNISVGFNPTLLVDVDESKGTMNLDGWVYLSWSDYHLKWDSADYDGIEKLNVLEKDVWTPDLKLYKGRSDSLDFTHEALILLFSSGNIIWVPPSTLHSTCDFSKGYKNYPRDTHDCTVKLGSWTYDGNNIDLLVRKPEKENSELEDFQDVHAEWTVTNTSVSRHVIYYSCCQEPYVTISFNLTLQRKGSEDVASGIILSISGALVLIMFWLPITSGWKFALSLTALLMETWSSIEIVKIAPSVGVLPYALGTVKTSMILSLIALIVEVLIVTLGTCSARSPPSFISSALRGEVIRRFLCLCGVSNESASDEVVESENHKIEPADYRRREWQQLATVFDRFAFLIFLILFLDTAVL